MKSFLAILIITGSALKIQAQSTFITKGKIEYEKVVNLYKVLEDNFAGNDNTSMWTDALKKNMPKTGSSYFDLYFNDNKSLYKPGKEVTVTQRPNRMYH